MCISHHSVLKSNPKSLAPDSPDGEALEPPLPKNKWILTQGAFDLLLAQLDTEREQAGNKYEALRSKLVKFFQWRGCSCPEDLADETINRVAKNLEAGDNIRHLVAYCVGIARHVFLESLRTQRREDALQATYSPNLSDNDPRLDCLERCLRELSSENFQLIVQYYQENEESRIEARRNLALRFGIPPNALRIRAHRIRLQLQGCVEACVRRIHSEGNGLAKSSH